MLKPILILGVGLSVDEIGLRWMLFQRKRNFLNHRGPDAFYVMTKKEYSWEAEKVKEPKTPWIQYYPC